MSDIKSLLQRYEEVNAELNKQIAESGTEFVKSLFTEVFKENEGLKVVGIVGYTPSFNDGEACTHSQYTFVGEKGEWGSYDFEDEIGNFEEDFELQDEDGVTTCINDSCKTLSEALDKITSYDEIFTRIYDTNFRIVVSLDDEGNVVVSEGEYDCGY